MTAFWVFLSLIGSVYANDFCQVPYFEISKAGKPRQSAHLVGTLHMGVFESDLDPRILEDAKNAQLLIRETKPVAETRNMLMRPKKFLPGNFAKQSIKENLSQGAWNNLTKSLPEIGESELDEMSPLEIQKRIFGKVLSSLKSEKNVPKEEKTMDGAFLHYCEANPDCEVDGLETQNELKKFTEKLFTPEILESQLQTVNPLAGFGVPMEVLPHELMVLDLRDKTEHFCKGEVNESQDPDVLERNLIWISRMDKLMEIEKSIFISVGAEHLYGPKGFIQLLKDRGYNISPLKIF